MTDTATAPAAPDTGAAPAQGGPFTPAQLQTMAGDLVARGLMSREQADAALKADNAPPLPAADPSTGPTPAQEIDGAFPAARPEEYHFPPLTPPNQAYTKEVAEFDRQARGWLSEARLPAPIGSYVAKEVSAVAEIHRGMNDADRQVFQLKERAKLDRLWGDQAEAKIGLARQLVQELEQRRPGVVAYLEQSGAGNSANIIAQLALHAERLAARHG